VEDRHRNAEVLDPRDDPQGDSVEVYVSVVGRDRAAAGIRWRWIAVAGAVLVVAAVVLVMSLGSGHRGGRIGSQTPSGLAQPGPCIYQVAGTARGCAAVLAIKHVRPGAPAAHRLLLRISHPYLPLDARKLVSTDSCIAWESATLERATGRAYVTATVIPEPGSSAAVRQALSRRQRARAEIEVTPRPAC
jgi:hypothetical protein